MQKKIVLENAVKWWEHELCANMNLYPNIEVKIETRDKMPLKRTEEYWNSTTYTMKMTTIVVSE